ncbi:MAG: polysaccharide deacetylase family protein [Sphingomonadaceae bacterium]
MNDAIGLPNRRVRNQGRLDHPARVADRVTLSSSFGKRFAVFVDTEEEFDWSQPRSRSATATSATRYLPQFQALMDAHGICPNYMIDYPVADSPESVEVLAKMIAAGNCAIGTQLHPWVNPPFDEDVITFNSYAGNLPVELERNKLNELTNKIEAALGTKPIMYRAGRYGVGPHTAAILEELGYRMDTSVRPYFDYSHEGGPNFSRHDPRLYWAGPTGSLLEAPLSVTYTGQLRRFGRYLFGNGRSRVKMLAGMARSGMLARVALTPEDMPIEDVKTAIRALLADGQQYFSLSFHSPSLTPGHTPYVRNSAELSDFYRWWDKVLSFLQEAGITPVSVDELLREVWANRASS